MSRPAEAEARFSFAGLRDLLGTVLHDVAPQLPGPQRRALEAALALSDADGNVADEGVVALGFLTAVRALASTRPILLAIDDVQWLDATSLSMLQFVLTRLASEPVATIVTARGEEPGWLQRIASDARIPAMHLGPLSVGALYELLRTRLGAVHPRPTLLRIWETSGGNAFFALELATALQQHGGRVDPGEELPIPGTLDGLVAERLDRLDGPAIEVACVVAALANPTERLVVAAAGSRAADGIFTALQTRILEIDGNRLRFAHPLIGSAVAARSSPSELRALHSRLARIVTDPEERARHLALATPEPDNEVAAAVESAATSVRARGAAAAAAELAELAIRLTPVMEADDLRRRVIDGASRQLEAGDGQRAIALLEGAYAAAPVGLVRADILVRLAGTVMTVVGPQASIDLYRRALVEAESDDGLAARIHMNIADCLRLLEDREQGVAEAELAIQAAARVGDDALRCEALAQYGQLSFSLGHGIPRQEMDEALALERAKPDWALNARATSSLAHQLVWSGDLERARQLIGEWREGIGAVEGYELTRAMWFHAVLEWRAGNWELAAGHAADALTIRAEFGRRGGQPIAEFPAALIAAHRGLLDEATERSERSLALAEKDGIKVAQSGHRWVLGFVELSRGDTAAALEYLMSSRQIREDVLLLEPGQQLEMGDLIEALVDVGRVDEADRWLRPLEERSRTLDRSSGLALSARCRGLILAAQGDAPGAEASFEQSLVEHARTEDPFQHGRTLLALGRTRRRGKQRAAAREVLAQALAIFERVGAPLWADKARAELQRIGGRVRSANELTEAERRIALLVAEGRTNREVAAALFVTEHTVEAALTRAYRKLEVRSRAELAARLNRESVGPDSSNL